MGMARPDPLIPDTGRAGVYQRLLDLEAHLNVLSLALNPGYEDLATLAYIRLARGATLVCAYVSNGEAGESDLQGEYPHHLAAVRREEAVSAVGPLEAEVNFLNLPDIASAANRMEVLNAWEEDTLRARLQRLIIKTKPDVILLHRDWSALGEGPVLQVLRAELVKVLTSVGATGQKHSRAQMLGVPQWKVLRLYVDKGDSVGSLFPLERIHPFLKNSFQTIGNELSDHYRSLFAQRALRADRGRPSYHIVYPDSGKAVRRLEEEIRARVPTRFRAMDRKIGALVGEIRGQKRPLARSLKTIAALVDSVDFLLPRSSPLDAGVLKILVNWKGSLENLRNVLLGVHVEYRVSERILAPRQLTLFAVDTVTGAGQGGETEIYFPAVEKGWIANESATTKFPLTYDQPYRLVSPAQVEYNWPQSEAGLTQTGLGTPFRAFIIHKAKEKERNFVYRVAPTFYFAPRFEIQVLTPLVRVVAAEQVIVRMTNHSRDGVADLLSVDDSIAQSVPVGFALSFKEARAQETLLVRWKEPLQEGTYLVSLVIGEEKVARFGARKFNLAVDTTRRVGVMTGTRNSPTMSALRRLGLSPFEVSPSDPALDQRLRSLDVLIIDRRALTLQRGIPGLKRELVTFAREGGHLIVLAQDAQVWNREPLWDDIRLSQTSVYGADARIIIDTSSALMSGPNRVEARDFDEWLFRKAYNLVSAAPASGWDIPLRSPEAPLLVSSLAGRGRITYADLALHPQWLNIQPGAYRLLANMVSACGQATGRAE